MAIKVVITIIFFIAVVAIMILIAISAVLAIIAIVDGYNIAIKTVVAFIYKLGPLELL